MKRLTVWTATSVLVLCFWIVLFMMTASRTGKIVLGVLLVGGIVWGVYRLVTYEPEHQRGAGTLEEVKQFSRLMPLEEPVPPCISSGSVQEPGGEGRHAGEDRGGTSFDA